MTACRSPGLSMAIVLLALASAPPLTAQNVTEALLPVPGFDAQFEMVGGEVYALVPTADGGLFVSGIFSRVNGVPRPGLVRLDAAGAVDPAFDPVDTGGVIASLAEQPDGRIMIVGEFYEVGGLPRRGIARLNADGSLDASFDPGTGFSVPPHYVGIQPDGMIVIDPSFGDYDGRKISGLVRLFPDGTFDPDFARGIPSAGRFAHHILDPQRRLVPTNIEIPTSVPGFSSINTVALGPNGTIMVSGLLTGTFDVGVARLGADGMLDPTFVLTGTFDNYGTFLLPLPDGSVIAAGDIESFSGTPTLQMARLNADGTLDPTFSVGAGATGTPAAYRRINSIARRTDGSLLVGGFFVAYDGNPAVGLARLEPDGTFADTWNVMMPGEVRTAVAGAGETWLVGGRFDAVDGTPVGNIVRLNAAGEVDPGFDPGAGFDGAVNKIVASGDTWIVAGAFTTLDDSPSAGIARLLADGARDSSFVVGAGFDGEVMDLIVQPDGRPVVVGSFYTYDGIATSAVTRLETNGSRDATLNPSFNFSTRRLALAPNGSIYVAGMGLPVPGSSIRSDPLVRMKPDGSADGFSTPSAFVGGVVTMIPLDDGRILVARGESPYLGRLLNTGEPDPSFSSDHEGSVTAMALTTEGRILVAGSDSVYLNNDRSDPISVLNRLNEDGSLDATFPATPTVSSSRDMIPQAVIPTSDGGLFLAGSRLPSANWQLSQATAVMRLRPSTTSAILDQPQPRSVAAGRATTLSVRTVAPEPVTYQWFRDGEAIAGADEATYTLPRPQVFQAGDYSVEIQHAGGTLTSDVATVAIDEHPTKVTRLLNISTRTYTSTGEHVAIPGFVVQGTAPKRLVFRAVGPFLSGFGVAGMAPDPRLVVKRLEGDTYVDIASNNDWPDDARATEQLTVAYAVAAYPIWDPSKDAALLLDLDPGTYTVVVDDATGASGVVLAELYDGDGDASDVDARLVNISTRGYARTGGEIMIPGFAVSPEGSKTVLIRAVGPRLADYGVTDFLVDPILTVYQGSTALFGNDDWSADPENAQRVADAEILVGAFPLSDGSTDAAMVVTLPGGTYTVHVAGKNGGMGTALAEVYELP